jgi:CubicO group peptidase (beta-lactamase class C family)
MGEKGMRRSVGLPLLLLVSVAAVYAFMTCVSEPSLSSMEVSEAQRAELASIMEVMAASGQFSGTVLVSVGGQPVYTGALGLADIERNAPNTLSTQFRIASATKPFTALLVYQLAAAGKLSLDDKLSDWLPEYPAEKGARITVYQLMTHRSGIIGEGRIPELQQIERHRWTRDELLQEIAGRDLAFAPGSGHEYSNYGYFLLGLIIERAGGASYADQLRDRICDPAGMQHTRGDDNDAIIPGRALGYHFDYLAGPQNAPYLDMSFVFGYGHLLSTAPDLHRFAMAVDNPAVLPPDYREMFFNECGWTVQSTPVGSGGRRVRGNYLSGSINGFASHILRIQKDNVFIALLKNMKEPGAQIVVKWPEFITSRLLAVLYGEPHEVPRSSAAFAVFEAVRDNGIEAGRKAYSDLVVEDDPAYYFDKDEFERLAEVLPAMNEATVPR